MTTFEGIFNSVHNKSFTLFFPGIFQAELRASVFEAIEEEDRVIEKDDGLPPALLGSCNDRAKQLHASPSGLITNYFIPS